MYLILAVIAIIAALSVVYSNGRRCNFQFFSFEACKNFLRNPELAETPPDMAILKIPVLEIAWETLSNNILTKVDCTDAQISCILFLIKFESDCNFFRMKYKNCVLNPLKLKSRFFICGFEKRNFLDFPFCA